MVNDKVLAATSRINVSGTAINIQNNINISVWHACLESWHPGERRQDGYDFEAMWPAYLDSCHPGDMRQDDCDFEAMWCACLAQVSDAL